ncbi:GTPase activating protein [Chytriomyces hyalinus]|nr:GTPase activating protein [Chytriomyces hyalinus]
MDTRARLLYAKSNLSKATPTKNQIGFLCLVALDANWDAEEPAETLSTLNLSASSPSHSPAIAASTPDANIGVSDKSGAKAVHSVKAFVWLPKEEINAADLPVFRSVAKSTKALFGPNPPPSPVSPSATLADSNQPQQRASSPLAFLFGTTPPSTPAIATTSSPSPSNQSSTISKKPSTLTISTAPNSTTAKTNDCIITLPPRGSPAFYVKPINSLSDLVMEPCLTVGIDGAETCLVKLTFREFGAKNDLVDAEPNSELSDDLAPVDYDALWFEKDEDGNERLAIELLVGELHVWLSKACHKGLKPIFEEDASSSNSNGMSFKILDVKDLKGEDGKVLTPVEAVGNRQAWPTVFPANAAVETSTVYKIGSFGLGVVGGVVGAIVGTGVTQKAEEIARNAAWDALDQFSKVTKFAQDTTRQVVEHPLARPVLPLIPTQLRDMVMSSEEAEQLMTEYDSASMYLSNFADSIQSRVKSRLTKRRQRGESNDLWGRGVDTSKDFEILKISTGFSTTRTGFRIDGEQWVLLFDEQGKLALSEDDLRSIIFTRGVATECRREIWKYLLKMYTWDSVESERVQRHKLLTSQYESMKRQWRTVLTDSVGSTSPLPSPTKSDRQTPTTAVGDERVDGDVPSKIKERKMRVEKDVVRTDRMVDYFRGAPEDTAVLLVSPTSPSYAAATLSPKLDMLKNVLMTYTVFEFDLGYVQGMNDLLSPILAVMDDEVEAFWCFVTWMKSKKSNFYRDQSGMHHQLHLLELLIRFIDPFLHAHLDRIDSTNLFCCFRWMLIVFKREFKFEQILTVWEAIWACPFTIHFHFFIALAILNKHRAAIMTQCTAFDEALKFMNDLSETHDVEDIIKRAEVLFYVFKQQLQNAMAEQEEAVHGAVVASSSNSSSSNLFPSDSSPKQDVVELTVPKNGDEAGGKASLSRASSRSGLGGGADDVGSRAASPLPPSGGTSKFTAEQLVELAFLLEM